MQPGHTTGLLLYVTKRLFKVFYTTIGIFYIFVNPIFISFHSYTQLL